MPSQAVEIMRNGIHRLPVMNAEFGIELYVVSFGASDELARTSNLFSHSLILHGLCFASCGIGCMICM